MHLIAATHNLLKLFSFGDPATGAGGGNGMRAWPNPGDGTQDWLKTLNRKNPRKKEGGLIVRLRAEDLRDRRLPCLYRNNS